MRACLTEVFHLLYKVREDGKLIKTKKWRKSNKTDKKSASHYEIQSQTIKASSAYGIGMSKPIVPADHIQFTGAKELNVADLARLNQLATQYLARFKRKLNQTMDVNVQIKIYEKEGGKNKYSIHVRVAAPTKILESCNSHDFDFVRAIHKAFEDIEHQIVHRFHNDVSRPCAHSKSSRKGKPFEG